MTTDTDKSLVERLRVAADMEYNALYDLLWEASNALEALTAQLAAEKARAEKAEARIKELEGVVELWKGKVGGAFNRRDAAEARAEKAEAALRDVNKMRDDYASQAQFADVDPGSYFREFVRRIDVALGEKP